MRKLLRGMRLPNHQWPEAMDHAVMLHKLLSSSSLPNNASPHLLWTGKQGSTTMLRVFGCMVQYRPPSARAGRFSQRAQWGLHLGIERNYNAWKIFDVHSKEKVAARDVIFYERLTLPTYLANLEVNRDPTGDFHGDRHFASAADKADWDEQNVDNASEEAGPLLYCSVPIPMDDENPRESVNAETYFDLADTDGEDTIYLNAAKYADTIAKRFVLTPTTISTPYRYTAGNDKTESALLKPTGIRSYQRKLGCLLFAAVTCRPNLSYSASQLATYLKRPEDQHMKELDRALHYLVSTPTIGLLYYKNITTTPKLIGYVDADHAGDSDNMRSRTGYIYCLEPIGPISWQSSKQELIALSSAEAEYIALCSATKEGLYLRELLEEAKLAQLLSFSLFCDNQSAIRIANKNGFANRTKHIALRYFFVKDEIEKGRLELSYCPTSEMGADYLTKKLGKSKFEYCMLLTGQSHVTCSDTPEAKGSVGNNRF
ncbi:unnamed protein product [Closterium sp. NIES-54]